jgi:predicted transcriptional regulator of viral defense system
MSKDAKPKSVPLHKAVTLSLGELEGALVSYYQLGLLVFRLHTQRSFREQPLAVKKEWAEQRDIASVLAKLLEEGILEPYKAITTPQMYLLLGRTSQSPPEIVCSADPFCYVSHLSAMEYHGLTDRITPLLNITRPASKDWTRFALERAEKDYGETFEQAKLQGFPILTRPKFEKRIGDRTVVEVNSLHLGAYRTLKDSPLRVATLGRTYLDMLRRPDLCGGIHHVLAVFDASAQTHLSTIVDEVERNGTPIEKVRAGYILEERCKITHPIFIEWVKHIARGGSRKLDPQAEYSPRYSAKWSLSINVDEPLNDETN